MHPVYSQSMVIRKPSQHVLILFQKSESNFFGFRAKNRAGLNQHVHRRTPPPEDKRLAP
jgi:hypothetical protein